MLKRILVLVLLVAVLFSLNIDVVPVVYAIENQLGPQKHLPDDQLHIYYHLAI